MVTDVMRYINTKDAIPALFDGMATVLGKCAAQTGIFISSATYKPLLRYICAHHGIAAIITDIIGVDVPSTKGEKIIQRLKPKIVPNKTIYMVGDSVSDMDAACIAEITPIGVAWGWQRPAD